MTEPTTSEYILLFRGGFEDGLTPADVQRFMEQFMAWADRLAMQGKLRTGHPLGDQRMIVSGRNRVVSDGPFAETKETLGGYFVLIVADADEALAIAKDCPGLDYGIHIEVRRHFQTREEKQREEPLHVRA
jgi:hypothetical protein